MLRDGTQLEGSAFMSPGQHLTGYLSSRKTYVNLVRVRWPQSGEEAAHLVLNLGQVLWASALEEDMPLSQLMPAAVMRPVEITTEGGLLLQCNLQLGADQRLSDFMSAAGAFLPVFEARLLPSEKLLGNFALNADTVHLVREISLEGVEAEEALAAAGEGE